MKKIIILVVLLVALLVPVTVFGTAAANVDRLVVVEITADGESNVLGTASHHLSRLNDLVGAFGFQLARTTDTIRTAVPNDGFVTVATAEAHLVNPNHIHISGMTGTILQRIRWSSGNYYADLADVAAWLGYAPHSSMTVGNTFYYVVVRAGTEVPVGLFYIGEAFLAPGETMNLSNWLVNTTNVSRPTWASSNRSVATINSNGVVTAVAAGTTNITVTARGGHRVVIPVEVRLTLNSATDVSIDGLSRLFGGAEVEWTGTHFNVRPSRNTNFYVTANFPGAVFINGVEQEGAANFQTRHWVIEIWPDDPATTSTATTTQTNAPAGAINISVAAGTSIEGLRAAFGANAEVTVGSANHVVVRPVYGVTINLTITSGDGDVLTGGASIVGTTRVVGHDNWIEFWS